MSATLPLSATQIAVYRAAAQKRRQQERSEIDALQEKAWEAARCAAQLLKAQYGVSRVVLFGSLALGTGFTRWSDVDIAAWDIAPEDTFRALGAVMDLDTDVPVNLVDVNTVRPSLLITIERDGIEL